MRKKNRKYLLLALPLVLVVFLFADTSQIGSAGVEFITKGTTFSVFGSLGNFAVQCDMTDKLEVFVKERGQYVQVAHHELGARPMFSVVNRNTGEEITGWRDKVNIDCDFREDLIDSLTVEGSILFQISTPSTSGADNIIKTVNVPVNTKILKDGQDRFLVAISFDSKDIEDLLRVNSNDHAWVTIYMTPDLTFTQTGPGGTQTSKIACTSTSFQDLCSVSMYTQYLVERSREQPQTASLGTQVRIESFDPKSFQLPLSSNQRFMTVIGSADSYQSSEGLPTIQLTQPNGVKSATFKMKELTNTSGDKWTNFRVTIQLPPNPQEGTWSIKMDSPAVTRQHSIRTFSVLGESQQDSPTDSGNDKSDESGSSSQTTGLEVDAVVAYKILYQGNEINSNLKELEESATSFGITPLQLVDDFDRPKITDAKLSNIRLEATLLDTKNLQLVSSSLKYDTTVNAEGKQSPIPEIDRRETVLGTSLDCYKQENGNCIKAITVSFTSLETKEIEDQLKALEITPSKNQRVPVTLETNVNGELVLRDSKTSQRYELQIQDLLFQYKTHYALASEIDSDGDGINDDGSINCADIDNKDKEECKDSSGGCFDFFGTKILCPKDESGDEETDTSLDKIVDAVLGALGNNGERDTAGSSKTCVGDCDDFNLDDQTVLILLVALAVLIMVIVAISRRKRF